VPNGTQCTPFAGSDQDNDGLFTPANPYAGSVYSFVGDIYNFGRDNAPATTINGDTTLDTDLDPYTNDVNVTLATQSIAPWTDPNSVSQPQSYGLNFDVLPLIQLPVAVQLQSPSPNVNSLMDVTNCLTCGTQGEFNMTLSTNATLPTVGDTYSLLVSNEALVDDTPTLSVTGVNTAYAFNLSASGGATPTFTWMDPGVPTDYTYRFTLTDASGNPIWKIPAKNSLPGLSSATTSISWPTDPTDPSNAPSGTLASGTKYVWSVTTVDSNGNQAIQKQVYQP
jgi:hypothetical protein